MKLLLAGIVIGSLVALPLLAVQTLVLPEIRQLQYSYAHADQTVNALFPGQ